jgi:hypothetical protein
MYEIKKKTESKSNECSNQASISLCREVQFVGPSRIIKAKKTVPTKKDFDQTKLSSKNIYPCHFDVNKTCPEKSMLGLFSM